MSMYRPIVYLTAVAVSVCLAAATAFAGDQPTEESLQSMDPQTQTLSLKEVDLVEFGPVDVEVLTLEDEARSSEGLPERFAVKREVAITPFTDGTWETLRDGSVMWRLRIISLDAISINLGFASYHMPEGGQLNVYATDGSYSLRAYTDRDNKKHGQLWTPVVLSDDIIVEVVLPDAAAKEALDLKLVSINHGYRGFGEPTDADKDMGPRQGSCNNDVICPEGDDWRDEIQTVAAIQCEGYMICTGFMVNNTAQDQTPYFMTANHCEVDSGNAATLVCYWNFHSPNCGDLCCGSLDQNQTGATHLASYSSSDFTLVLLDDDPDPDWNVAFAGWDRSDANPTSAVGIHHPGVDEKAISFEDDACTTTNYLGTSTPGDGTHIRVIDWDDGTTEGGSSGSPLFNQNHRVVGQLHGGYAACGNDESDWYGRFSVSWSHGLSSYLDPIGSGATALDTLVPGATGMKVTPGGSFDSAGDPGGPFSPSSQVYTLENQGDASLTYTVSKTQSWVTLSTTGGTLAPGATANVTVSINSNANSLSIGVYTDTVSFTNTTTGEGNTVRTVNLQVGGPSVIYDFPMDTNPGWTTQGLWAFGQPTGDGGDHGEPDPESGHTGTNVYGYNLQGDYPNNMSSTLYVTTTALDFSNVGSVELRFWRYLNVESSSYDHATLQVSNNGSSWTTLWENPSGWGSSITDSTWSQQIFDISAVADGQATVYVRWGMGPTDNGWQFSGWNVDDVEFWGVGSVGIETCDDGILNQGEDRIDCGGPCAPCECTSDAACDNGAFCDGEEYCDDYGMCNDGDLCSEFCHEATDTCFDCAGITVDCDMNGDGSNGLDIQLFIDAILGTATIDEICHGDFTADGMLTADDIPGFVDALLD